MGYKWGRGVALHTVGDVKAPCVRLRTLELILYLTLPVCKQAGEMI